MIDDPFRREQEALAELEQLDLRPSDPRFWTLENKLLSSVLIGLVMDMLIQSGEAGVNALPRGYGQSFEWETFNDAAVNWARQYFGTVPGVAPGVSAAIDAGQPGGWGWAAQLNDTTRQAFMREFEAWHRSGEPLDAFEARIMPWFGEARARRIAVTEVTRIYSAGNVMAWQTSGVVTGKLWDTARDERVCPICSPLHGTLVELSGGWNFSQAHLDANPALKALLKTPTTIIMPPAHVHCLLPGTAVHAPGHIRYATKSFYDGVAVEVRTESGRILTVTQNHPILTGRGWIAADEITETDYVFSSGAAERIAAAVGPDNDDMPALVEDVFRALWEAPDMVVARMPAAAEHFHGDGRFMDGYVEVVTTDRLLHGGRESAFGKPGVETTLASGGLDGRAFPGLGSQTRSTLGVGLAARGSMSCRHLLPPLSVTHLAPFDELGFGLVTPGNAMSPQVSGEGFAADSELSRKGVLGFASKVAGDPRLEVRDNYSLMGSAVLVNAGRLHVTADSIGTDAVLTREFLDRFAGDILADNVIEVREFNFSGHVYNLQVDPYSLYLANGIIAHNCRCGLRPVVIDAWAPGELDDKAWKP